MEVEGKRLPTYTRMGLFASVCVFVDTFSVRVSVVVFGLLLHNRGSKCPACEHGLFVILRHISTYLDRIGSDSVINLMMLLCCAEGGAYGV